MGLSSTLICTSGLILCSTIWLFDSLLANHKLSYISKYISVTYAFDLVHEKIDVWTKAHLLPFYLTNLARSRLSVSGGLKKRAGDKWGLVGKKERSGEPVSIVLKTLFWYTSSWYTLWLVTFDSLYQHLVCFSEAKWRLTWRAWYTRVISRSPNLLKRSEWSKERVWSIWPLDRCFCHYWSLFPVISGEVCIFLDGFRCL